jgi:hypothetical protein
VIWFRTRDILSVPVPVIICSKFAASVSFDDWFAGCTRTASQASAFVPGLFVLGRDAKNWIAASPKLGRAI